MVTCCSQGKGVKAGETGGHKYQGMERVCGHNKMNSLKEKNEEDEGRRRGRLVGCGWIWGWVGGGCNGWGKITCDLDGIACYDGRGSIGAFGDALRFD